MKKLAFILKIILSQPILIIAQTPQIAVVKPNGTTFIYSNWDSAYANANNGDNIYLPGGTFNVTHPIIKSLNIFGAGFNEDSSMTTGITRLNPIIILAGADFGSIEGISFNPTDGTHESISFGNDTNTNPLSNYIISKCYIQNGINFKSPCTNIIIKDNRIGHFYYTSINGTLSNSLITNNTITAYIHSNTDIPNLEVSNNIFLFSQQGYNLELANYSTYKNNISLFNPYYVSNSNFYNNINMSPSSTTNSIFGSLFEPFDSSFINAANNNFHIRPTSLCKNSGTDGTDRGIYGGAFPWTDGSIPSNPHIYFKQVASQTNNNGELQIQFKVRTNN